MTERVLLVDDETEFLEIMAERMRARDMEVTTSTSATEALSLIATESYDAVIMDFMMPEMDGIQALKVIKEKRPEMQIILLTGHATVEKGGAHLPGQFLAGLSGWQMIVALIA
ncbi:MAG: response regulator [Desulfosarcina sp.]|nr:response regulator [Desulfosarcina sp.]MBC2766551.1 response regulator [Desulfosarcina sp.]